MASVQNRMDTRRPAFHDIAFSLCGCALLVAAAIAYSYYRQRYIGGSDSFGYYELGRLLAHGKVHLDLPLSTEIYPATVPLSFGSSPAGAVPLYPPGYPLLLAVAGWFGAEFFVTPAIGVLSIALVYLAAREFAERWLALAVAASWAFLPIVVFGATNVMSDLVAAVPLLGSYLLYRRGWLRTSALVLGTAFWVRPTNALYAVLFAAILLRDHRLVRYVLWSVPTAAIYGVYNHLLYGAPWRTGYGNFTYDLTASVFAQHFGFYLGTTLIYLGPVLALALLGLRRMQRSDALFLLAWPAAFIVFYSFWRSGGDAWWWSRFILPGYAALFLLAAAGLQQIADWLVAWRDEPWVRRSAFAGLVVFVGVTICSEVDRGLGTHDLWTRNKCRRYYDVARLAATFVPNNAYIGSIEFGGSVQLYTSCHPFFSGHSESPRLVGDLLARKIPVLLIVEPWNDTHPEVSALRRTFNEELVKTAPMWGNQVKIYRLTLRSAQG